MKLRTRLFLWVGSLFFLFFLIAYFVETFLVRRSIDRSEEALRSEIEEVNREKHKHLEEFLGIVIADLQGKVDSLLYRLEEETPMQGKFLPENKTTWAASSELLLTNKWVDFIQNTANGKITSLIVPNPLELTNVRRIWIDEDLSWIEKTIEGQRKIYLGIRVSPNFLQENANSDENLTAEGKSNLYYFFDWQEMMQQEPLAHPKVDTEELFGSLSLFAKDFVKKYNKALLYLQKNQEKIAHRSPEELKEWITSQRYRKSKPSRAPLKPELYEGKNDIARDVIQQSFEEEFSYHLNHDRIDNMIWGLSPLWVTNLLGEDPLSKRAPTGVLLINEDRHIGKALFSEDIFSHTRIFQDQEYAEHAINQKKNRLIPSIALIFNPNNTILYFGNTLKFQQESNTGYLTLGVNIDRLVQQLSVMTNQKGVLSYQGRVISFYDENGVKLDKKELHLPLSEMRSYKSGIFKYKGEKYYFANLQPFHEIDLHFYVYEPSTKAFAFIDFLRTKTKEVINKISLNMRIIALIALIIGLFLLHNISKNIIKPIAQLAKATSTIGAGDFDKVELPEISHRKKDEIVSLVESFSQMLQGLKDREKVRGVLNKFVSKEIAKEILKGEVHLGGEERVISILFADIRSFTKMTEKMAPHEVVDMLNQCMTKVTKVVDEAGGVIDKYVGDEAMALYGAPVAHADSALRAIYSGIKMIEEMKNWNEEREKKQLPKIELGIGIHTGNVLVGNMGAEDRLNYTVLGSNVNLAARLCSYAKPSEILITEETLQAEHVRDAVEVEKLEAHQFKGFTHETPIYRIVRLKDSSLSFSQQKTT